MDADDEETAGDGVLPQAVNYPVLEVFVKIGEGEVAAESEMVLLFRGFFTEIPAREGDRFAIPWSQLENAFLLDKSFRTAGLRKFLETARTVARGLRPCNLMAIDLGALYSEIHGGVPRGDGKRLEQHRRIGLLPRSRPHAPAAGPVLAARAGKLHQRAKHQTSESLEDGPVPVEPTDGYTAETIEDTPLPGILLETLPVGVNVRKPQRLQSTLPPLADLPAHFPESPPAHSKARQGPLQELDTLGVFHISAATPVDKCDKDASDFTRDEKGNFEKASSKESTPRGRGFDLPPVRGVAFV